MELYIMQFSKVFTSTEFVIFLWVMIADIIIGNVKAFVKKEWNSHSGLSGLLKHFSITTFSVLVLSSLTLYHNTSNYQDVILLFLTGINMMSILENLSHLGVKFPEKITQYFSKFKKGE